MIRKLLAGAVLVVIGAWLLLWGAAEILERRYAARAWPAGLGSLDEVPKRFPPTKQSAGATKLVQLAAAAEIDLDPAKRVKGERSVRPPHLKLLSDHQRTQLERSADAIDPLPPPVAESFAKHDAALNAIRDHLLSGATIAWESDVTRGFEAPTPNLLGHMFLQRLLIARALEKARNNDPASWNELRASWELSRGLWSRSDLMSILIALSSTRMSNAAARKLPLPAPAWFAEQQSFDVRRAMAAAQQADAWAMAHYEVPKIPTLEHIRMFALGPWHRWSGASGIELMRRYNAEALRDGACDVDSTQYAKVRASLWTYMPELTLPNLTEAWRRTLRYRAEAEATARVLQLRAGETPSAKSMCSDGTWEVTATSMKFTRNVKVEPPGIRYPLEYSR